MKHIFIPTYTTNTTLWNQEWQNSNFSQIGHIWYRQKRMVIRNIPVQYGNPGRYGIPNISLFIQNPGRRPAEPPATPQILTYFYRITISGGIGRQSHMLTTRGTTKHSNSFKYLPFTHQRQCMSINEGFISKAGPHPEKYSDR